MTLRFEIGARLLADREVIPQAMKLNPAFFQTIYADLLNAKKTRKNVQAALGLGRREVDGGALDAGKRAEFERLKGRFLGRERGLVPGLFAGVKELPPDERADFGARANAARIAATATAAAMGAACASSSSSTQTSAPGASIDRASWSSRSISSVPRAPPNGPPPTGSP